MIFAMRPKMYAEGLSSEKFEEILGKKVTKDLKKYDPITESVLA
jgi:sialic acid synthase SpsE